MPIVSIVIATYNSGKTIKNALESVYKQSFQDWECIVVDGASKDNTISIVKEYSDKDARFRYVSEKDRGIYDAFNKGWRMAKGEWVHYLGSDDRLTCDGMEHVVAELDKQYAVVTGDVYLERVDGTKRVQEYRGMFGCHQGCLMQRSVIDNLGGFDEHYRILGDYDLMARTQHEGYRVKNVRAIIAIFTVGGISQKIGTQWKIMMERYEIDKKNMVVKHPMLNAFKICILMSLSGMYRSVKASINEENK